MMAVIPAAAIAATGMVLCWWIAAVVTTAATSHSQERMQRRARLGLAESAPAPADDYWAPGEPVPESQPPDRDEWPLLS